MVIGEDMTIIQAFGGLGKIPDYRRVGPDFGLGEDNAHAHGTLLCGQV
jgi:hypothetical protein